MISKKSAQRLVETYAGETVIFYLKDMKISTVNSEGSDLVINAMVDGFVVDVDEHYFYLGDSDGGVDKTISHEVIAITEIAKIDVNALYVEPPSDDEDIH
jgi:hypothetical protein